MAELNIWTFPCSHLSAPTCHRVARSFFLSYTCPFLLFLTNHCFFFHFVSNATVVPWNQWNHPVQIELQQIHRLSFRICTTYSLKLRLSFKAIFPCLTIKTCLLAKYNKHKRRQFKVWFSCNITKATAKKTAYKEQYNQCLRMISLSLQ